MVEYNLFTRFFIRNAIFSTQPQCCLTFSRIELQMLLRGYLIHISIVILRHVLYLLNLPKCLDLGLFKPFLCGPFSFSSSSSLWLIIWSEDNRSTCFKHYLEYFLLFLDDNMDEEYKYFSNSWSSASGYWLAFADVLPISAWCCL